MGEAVPGNQLRQPLIAAIVAGFLQEKIGGDCFECRKWAVKWPKGEAAIGLIASVENSAKLIHETRAEKGFKRLKDAALVF